MFLEISEHYYQYGLFPCHVKIEEQIRYQWQKVTVSGH